MKYFFTDEHSGSIWTCPACKDKEIAGLKAELSRLEALAMGAERAREELRVVKAELAEWKESAQRSNTEAGIFHGKYDAAQAKLSEVEARVKVIDSHAEKMNVALTETLCTMNDWRTRAEKAEALAKELELSPESREAFCQENAMLRNDLDVAKAELTKAQACHVKANEQWLEAEGRVKTLEAQVEGMAKVVDTARRLRQFCGGLRGGVYGDMWDAIDALSTPAPKNPDAEEMP